MTGWSRGFRTPPPPHRGAKRHETPSDTPGHVVGPVFRDTPPCSVPVLKVVFRVKGTLILMVQCGVWSEDHYSPPGSPWLWSSPALVLLLPTPFSSSQFSALRCNSDKTFIGYSLGNERVERTAGLGWDSTEEPTQSRYEQNSTLLLRPHRGDGVGLRESTRR